jgi:glycosyltransferase involved in cell wall biosynthesis
MMCKLTGAKLVVVSDVTPTTEATTGLLKRVVRKAIAKNINAAVARSYTAKRYLESLGMRGQAIVVAPYAIEAHVIKKQGDVNTLANLVAQKSQKKFCFFYSGHFIHLKGIDLLVRAVASLPLEVRDKILIVLAGGSENELRELVGPYDTDKFLTLGFVPNDQILSVYPLADCFILPTRSDTWGLVVNEAVVAGCPVMVSKYAGSAGELIEDAISGIVFDPLDQKQFVDKLAFCIQNKALLVSYAAKAKEKLQEYNNDVSAKRIANLIEEINGK